MPSIPSFKKTTNGNINNAVRALQDAGLLHKDTVNKESISQQDQNVLYLIYIFSPVAGLQTDEQS